MRARHWRTLAVQLGILASMVVIALIDRGAFVVVVSVSVLVLPPVNWTVAAVLLWTSRQDPSVKSLADAADNALNLAVTSTAAAILAAAALVRAIGFFVNGELLLLMTVLVGFVVVTSSLPAFRFLKTWREVWMPMIRRSKVD